MRRAYAESTRNPPNRIADAIRSRAVRVGVFVNESAQRIADRVERIGLDAVQLHGDEPPEIVVDLPDSLPVIRASRVDERGIEPVATQIETAAKRGRPFAAVLLDAAAAPGVYGGSGRTADWDRISRERALLGGVPLILAGGLRPENVGVAIESAGPDGVDTASGVESAHGVKDAALVAGFVTAAREALSARGGCG